MRPPATAVAVLGATWLALSPRPVAACPLLSGVAELDLSAGHDDNLMLAVNPDASSTVLRLGGAYAAVSPLLAATCAGGGMGLRLTLASDLRQSDDVGRLDTHGAELRGWLPRWGALRLHLAARGGAFRSSQFAEDEYLFVGGEAGAGVDLHEELTLSLEGRADRRLMRQGLPPTDATTEMTRGPSRDWLLTAAARLRWRPGAWLEVGPTGSLLNVRDSLGAGTSLQRWQAGLGATADWWRLSASAETWGGRQTYHGLLDTTRETLVGGSLAVELTALPALRFRLTAEIAEPISEGAGRDYARRMVGLAVVLQASGERRVAPRAAGQAPSLRPLIQDDRVRLRLRAPAAREVSVVGSWNDWQTPGAALASAADGLWEVTLTLPPGTHRYHFLADGQAQRPPEAERYVADDFGSEDGVLEIAASAGPVRASSGADAGGKR